MRAHHTTIYVVGNSSTNPFTRCRCGWQSSPGPVEEVLAAALNHTADNPEPSASWVCDLADRLARVAVDYIADTGAPESVRVEHVHDDVNPMMSTIVVAVAPIGDGEGVDLA